MANLQQKLFRENHDRPERPRHNDQATAGSRRNLLKKTKRLVCIRHYLHHCPGYWQPCLLTDGHKPTVIVLSQHSMRCSTTAFLSVQPKNSATINPNKRRNWNEEMILRPSRSSPPTRSPNRKGPVSVPIFSGNGLIQGRSGTPYRGRVLYYLPSRKATQNAVKTWST